MTKEWEASCKDCGKVFGYSDTSYVAGMQRGFSRPERCPECRKRHAREIQTVGMPFFKVTPTHPSSIVEGVQAGMLGKIEHLPREHESKELPSSLDTSKFGITEEKLYELFDKLQKFQVVIAVGPTGSGKSTYLPYRLMVPPEGIDPQIFTRYGQILITQPRIQAARNIPAYVAKVMHGSSIGAGFDVGFRHSNAPASDWRCKLVYVTDGTLINWIVTGQISNLSVIMIDEAHERSLNIDLILGLLKKLLPRYPRMKLIVASATIDHEKFINYFGGEENVGFVEFEGKSYGVTEHHREELGKSPLEYGSIPVPQLAKTIHVQVSEQVLDLLQRMYIKDGDLHTKRGDILAFLHGVRPIEQAVALIKTGVEEIPELAGQVDVLPLYTTLSQEKQDQALGKPDWMKKLEATEGYENLSPEEQEIAVRDALYRSRRRVVISTNVAETSLTVHGILHVVDCGIINQDAWDAQTQTTVVSPVLHSRAGCQQRWGRAGRLMAGDAYCLYTKQQFYNDAIFEGYSKPQILRAPLEKIVLTAKAAGIDDLENFPWIDPPDTEELQRAETNLLKKKALDRDGDLTEHGLELQSFSEEPNLANMMVLADRFGCAIEMATLIPIMKKGRFGRLLKRERDWDANTRRSVRRIHRALTERCEDDIELCLKLCAAWSQSKENENVSDSWAFRQVWPDYFKPHISSIKDLVKGQLGEVKTEKLINALLKIAKPDELDDIIAELGIEDETLDGWLAQANVAVANALPVAWTRMFFANYAVFKSEVEVERDKLIDALSAHKKEDERRPIDFDLLTRLRIIFAYALPERMYKLSDQVTGEGDRIYQPMAYVENQPIIPAVVGTYSICYQKDIEAFVCSKQQTITRRLTANSDPTQVMMVSFLAKINPQWAPQILNYSPLALGRFIAKETRTDRNGELISTGAETRLMIDQKYPIGSRYRCQVLETNSDDKVSIKLQQRIASPPPVEEVYRSGEAALPEEFEDAEAGDGLLGNTVLEKDDIKNIVLDPEYEMEPAWIDLAQDAKETLLDDERACHACGAVNKLSGHYCNKCGALLQVEQKDNQNISAAFLEGWVIADGQTYSSGMTLQADVVGYDLYDINQPRIIMQPTPDPEPFVAFTQQNKVGDTIKVIVIEHDTYPGDYLTALVVRDLESKLEIVMEPDDLTFTNRGYIVQAISIGTKMEAVVEAINYEYRRVRLSCHKFVDAYQNRLFTRTREAVVNAVVGEITDRGVFFMLEWGDPQHGIVLGAYARVSDLSKQPYEYVVGENCIIRVTPPNRPKFWSFAELPPEVEKNLVKRKWYNRLVWDEQGKRLNFSGLMSYLEYQELKSYSEDEAYCRAVDELHVLCNQLEASVARPFIARAIIQRDKIGQLIGSRGSNINGIRNETLASIRIDDDRGLVIVEADSQEQIQVTTQRINESLDSPLSFQPSRPVQPLKLSDGVEDEPRDDFFTAQISIPLERAKTLIYSGGKTISALQETTETRIEIENETGVVTIEGLTQEQVDKAKMQIKELTTFHTATMQIDGNQIGQLIGKQEQTINRLKAESGAEINIGQNTPIVTIEGHTIEQVEAAIRGIEATLTMYQTTVVVLTTSLGRLFGRGGSIIKGICENTNTRINTDNNTGRVTIIGNTSTNVEKARQQVCDTVWVANPQTSVSLIGKPVVLSRSYSS